MKPRRSGSTPRSGPYLGGTTLLALLALASSRSLAANPYGPEGKSWTDPPLGEVLSSADVVAECRVVVGGQWRAEVELVRVLGASAGTRASQGDVVTVEGHNAFEWNTAHYAMRADDSAILALSRSGDVYTLPTPSSGRFPVEHGRVVGRFGGARFLVEIPLDAFRAALEAYFAEPLESARRLGRLAGSAALETRCLALVLLGELRPGAEDVAAALLEPLARDPNPALREVAAHALGRLGGPHAAKALASFLTDADRVVARAAALAVCEAKSSRGAIRELFAWLARSVADETSARRKEDIEAQGAVFKFLAEGGWEEEAGPPERAAVVRGLVEMIASGRTAVCIVAARALGMIGAKEAVPGLIRLLDAEDMRLREEARSALLMITVSPLAARRDEMTRWWHGHKDEPRRRWVARALALAERSLAADTYEAGMTGMMILIASRDPLAPWAARKKLAEGAGWPELPIDRLDGPLVAAFAERRLSSYSSPVRASGLRALVKLAEEFPSPERSFAGEFLRASYDPDTTPRKLALEALGREGSREAVGRLIDELEYSPSSDFKQPAAEALRKLTGRRFGFYISKGYDLQEEEGGLERWKRWHASGGVRLSARPGLVRKATVSDGGPTSGSRAPAGGREWPVGVRLADPDPDVWLAAACELVAGGAEARRTLERISRGEEARLRAVATALLGLRAEKSSTAALAERLDDREPFVRVQAAWALGRALGGSGSPPRKLLAIARKTLPEPTPGRTDGEPGSNPFVVQWPGVRLSVATPDVVQTTAIHALGKIGGDAALEVLRRAVESGTGSLAREAAWALDAFPGGQADKVMLAKLPDLASSAREFGARALARRRPPGAAGALCLALSQSGLWQTGALVEALVRVATPEDAGLLAELLAGTDEIGTFAASRALAETPGSEAAGALIKVMEEDGFAVRYYSAKALGKLGSAGRLDAESRAAASEALAGLFDQLEVSLASAAAAALEHAGEPAAAPAIFEHLASYDPPDARALGALVRLGGRKGLRFALEQWRTGRWAGKYFALHAMRYAPPAVAGEPDEAVRALLEAWRDPESPYQAVAARSLVALGGRAGPAVAALLRSDSADERRRAAELLGRIGGKLAVRALVAAIDRTTAGAGSGSSREAQALGFVADRALARTKGAKALLRLRSTPDERRAASARWKELSGL